MSFGSFWKKFPGRVYRGTKVGLKYAKTGSLLADRLGIPIPYIGLVKAAVAIQEARGGKDKLRNAVELVLPALHDAGLNVPGLAYKVSAAIHVLLDPDTNGLPDGDAVWTFDAKEAAKELDVSKIDAIIAEAAAKARREDFKSV
jgi:hypothetical protein